LTEPTSNKRGQWCRVITATGWLIRSAFNLVWNAFTDKLLSHRPDGRLCHRVTR